jgi:murein DD-endopeptidase MepM/ murein hydrolase activator NlpD
LRPDGRRSATPAEIDLGDEPALTLSGAEAAAVERGFSLRWLAATALTGLAGTALMGGALLAAVDGETRFARDPAFAQGGRPAGTAPGSASARRGDRLPPRIAEQQTRRIVQIATATRVGERQIVRTRPYARVQAQLALQRTALSAAIPAFNPLRIFNEAGVVVRAAPPAQRDLEGEMTVTSRPLADVIGPFAEEDRLTPEQSLTLVQRTVLAEAATAARADPQAPLLPARDLTPQHLMAAASSFGFAQRAPEGRANPVASAFRVFDENVTQIEKSRREREAAAAAGQASDETLHIVQRGESLATILVSYGASLQESRAMIEAIAGRFRSSDLREGHRLRIVRAPSESDPGRRTIARVAVLMDRTVLATAVLTDLGQYAAVDMSLEALDEAATAQAEEAEAEESEAVGATPTLYMSIYETALRNNVPRAIVDELIKIYSYDVDFQRRVRPGDSFEVFYAADDEPGRDFRRDDIEFAALTINGETRRYFRFRTDDDGVVDFYDERGRSAKKFLMRTPLNGGVFRSGFGFRRHPILGFSRMHTGVDWSAPIGTPVMAAGAGTVVKAEWVSGYGRRVEIQHSNGYVTSYSHLSGFGRNIQRGTRVTQGQVIGFLGSSGLSTGPHLHYEVAVNGSYVDPMRIRVPRGRVLEGRYLAEFERERIRIEQMMRRANGAAVARVGN